MVLAALQLLRFHRVSEAFTRPSLQFANFVTLYLSRRSPWLAVALAEAACAKAEPCNSSTSHLCPVTSDSITIMSMSMSMSSSFACRAVA